MISASNLAVLNRYAELGTECTDRERLLHGHVV